MQAHELRVVEEAEELEDRLIKLNSFLTTAIFENLDKEQRVLLMEQSEVMSQYLSILKRRINLFKGENHE